MGGKQLQVLHTIDKILFENLDVASSALSYLLLNVAGAPTVQEDLRREGKEAISSSARLVDGKGEQGWGPKGVDAYLGRSDTYLEQCCIESRRLCPAICE